MKILKNSGNERVIDVIRPFLRDGGHLDMVSPSLSLFAFAELLGELSKLARTRLLLPSTKADLALLGTAADRAARNRLQQRWLAKRCAAWLEKNVELRHAMGAVPQGALVLRSQETVPQQVVLGSFAFSTDGLGITPGNPLNLIQASENAEESRLLSQWFDAQWSAHQAAPEQDSSLLDSLRRLAAYHDPLRIYVTILFHLFRDRGEDMDEDRIVKSSTGIRDTVVWKKLFRFQRDGAIGAIDKLDRFGGCIIADSVGLGKTFEALAVIKYHELRNDRVLVLCPKRLRDNWTLYKSNDRRIAFATEGDDTALIEHGVASIDNTTRVAQKQFNRWLEFDDTERTPARLVEMLGFDYFSLLDLLTIARSRKHIEKYYGTSETGRFPDRLNPARYIAATKVDDLFSAN